VAESADRKWKVVATPWTRDVVRGGRRASDESVVETVQTERVQTRQHPRISHQVAAQPTCCQRLVSVFLLAPAHSRYHVVPNLMFFSRVARNVRTILQSQSATRSSAIAEGPRDASCQLKSCQLPSNSAETTYTTSPDQIDGMKLEI